MTNYQKSFTLVELLVVTSIIVLMTAIILPNYNFGQRQYALQRSAHKLSQDIRKAQEMTMSTKSFTCPTGTLLGYGAIFSDEAVTYSLFAKCSTGDNVVETLSLEKEIKILDLAYYQSGAWQSNQPSLWFYFTHPDPSTTIMAGAEQAKITLCRKDDPTKTKIITINGAGLVNIPEEGEGGSECAAAADCVALYGEGCGYGICFVRLGGPNKRPAWTCAANNCEYSCYNDPTCNRPPYFDFDGGIEDYPDPLNPGQTLTFSANWVDLDADWAKIHICKTDAFSFAGQSCSGGNWCITNWDYQAPTECQYTVTGGDVGTKNYYAFVCDNRGACNTISWPGTFNVAPL